MNNEQLTADDQRSEITPSLHGGVISDYWLLFADAKTAKDPI